MKASFRFFGSLHIMLRLFIHFLFCIVCNGNSADYGYIPKGENPTLYAPNDPILQLDEDTFSDTVYNANTSFLVEFYADWCGHCRAFAVEFKSFANDVKDWAPLVKIAALNCADPYNERICAENGIVTFPKLKYFNRKSSGVEMAQEFEQSNRPDGSLLSNLIEHVENEYRTHRYADWPNLELIETESTSQDLWSQAPESSKYLAIIFEEEELQEISIKLILDLNMYQSRLTIRRSSIDSNFANSLKVREPIVAVLTRNESNAQYFHESPYESLKNLVTSGDPFVSLSPTSTSTTAATTTIPPWSCRIHPEKCKELYFVSETDLLKATRYALYNDAPQAGGTFSGTSLTALRNFINLLAENFPTQQYRTESPDNETSSMDTVLPYSERARRLFVELQYFLDREIAASGSLPIAKWQRYYFIVERHVNLSSFSSNARWQHCRGSSKHFRGYTCGLWTTFHALTVNAYLNNIKNESFQPVKVLQAIQGWVDHFFGCRHCRDHFMNMTLKMDSEVKQPKDVVLYMWKAHNTVNKRLRGDDTEDVEFPKYQFPADFLCEDCSSGNDNFNETRVMDFMLEYYSTIRPQENEALHPFDLISSTSSGTKMRFDLALSVFVLIIVSSVL